jgi:ABC-type multidrug transport system fused ATPase/permease subunit
MRTLAEAAEKITRGLVGARRVVRVLQVEPEITDPLQPAKLPDQDELDDPDSGVRIYAGRLTAIAAADPADAQMIVDRLGRYDPASRARLSGVPLAELAVATVRERILVADNDARLFNGPLRESLAGPDLARVLHTASAEDIIDGLPDGLDTEVMERGREFSGGQQQRLKLVRALLADPPVLLLVEPTSAVDAHTEARIADRLAPHRRGRTTVVCTTSPLLLDRAEHVIYVERGRVVAEGRHRDLLSRTTSYRATVTREEDE